jgi:hypothetical protein
MKPELGTALEIDMASIPKGRALITSASAGVDAVRAEALILIARNREVHPR